MLSTLVLITEGLSLLLVLFISFAIYQNLWHKYYVSHQPYRIDAVDQELEQKCLILCSTLGLQTPPKIMCSNSSEATPWVFWKLGYYLIVPKNFLDRFRFSEPELTAVLLHELAHIKNNDVIKTILVQVLSAAYLIVAISVSILRIMASLSILNIGYSSILEELYRTIPILLSTLILLVLNRFIMQQRELMADRLVVFIQKDNKPLRSAIVFLGNLQVSTLPFSFIGSSRNFNKYRLFRYHPSPTERNRYIFDPRLRLTTSLGIAVAAGFASVVAVETGLHALGITPIGEGLLPLISISMDLFVGLLIFSNIYFASDDKQLLYKK